MSQLASWQPITQKNEFNQHVHRVTIGKMNDDQNINMALSLYQTFILSQNDSNFFPLFQE